MPSIDTLSIRISASTTDATTKVNALTKALESLVSAIDRLDVSKFETLSNAVDTLSQGISGLKGAGVKQIEKVGKAINSVNESAQKGTMDVVAKDVEKVSEKAKSATENLENVGTTYSRFDTSATDEMANSMQKVSDTVQKTANQMGTFKFILAKTKIIIPTEGLEKVDKKIQALTERIEDMKERMAWKSQTDSEYVNGKQIDKDREKLDGLINELERLKLKKQELESHGGFKLNLGTTISNLSKAFSSVNKKLDGFISKMRRAKSHTRDTAKATDSFKVASTKLAKELTRVTKMLKLMITRMILRKVIQNAIDGFKNLVQYSSEVDASVSLMWNSFRQLGNSVAAAVGPLINALAPALNYIIQLCIKVVNAINQVISALTGRSTWTRAKTLTDDYAKSLDKSNKSAKDLKRTILGFDEINKLDDNKDSGGGMTKPEDMFEDAKIEAKWADMAKKLRSILNQLLAPIKKAWSKIGDQVVAAWTGAFKSVKKLLGDIGRDFLKVWNQPRTVQMLETILRIFQDIGGIVKYLADGLDKAWNTNKTGLRILEAIRDIFLTIVTHIRNMTSATLEWAKNLNFTPLLEAFKDWVVSMKPVVDAIAGAFEDFYNNVLLPLGKWTIEKGLPELIQVFVDFNEKVDWQGLREKLADLWEHLEPFAERIGEGLILFIRDCSEAVANFVNSDTFQKFLDRVKDWMDNVDAEDVARTLKLVAGAIITLKGALFLLEGIKGINAVVTALKAFFGLFATGGAASTASTVIVDLTGALEGFGGALTNLGALAHVFESFTFAKTQKDVNSLTQEMLDGKISVDEYNKAVNDLKYGDAQSKFQKLRDWLKGIRDETTLGKDSIVLSEEAMSKYSSTAESLSIQIEKDTSSVKNLNDAVNKTDFNKLVDGTNKLGTSYKNTISFTPQFTASQKKIGESLKSVTDETVKFSNTSKTSWTQVTNDVSNAQLTLSGSMQEMSKDVDNTSKDITDSTNKIKDAFNEKEWTFDGVAKGLGETFRRAKEAIKKEWNEIADTLNGNHQLGGGTMNIHLPRFARGGFPEDGLFMANHNELVGKFDDGRTAVANNEQITTGIANAVYSAIMSANSGGTTRYINNTIQIDGRAIARAVTVGQDDQNRRYSPVMV